MKLARYEDSLGRSSGYWLVRAVPGLMVHRMGYGAWRLRPLNEPLVPGSPDFKKAERTWGKGSTPREALLLLQEHPHLKQWFQSRDAALLELEATLADKDTQLPGLLEG